MTAILLAASLLGCSGSGGDDDDDASADAGLVGDGVADGPCDVAERVGSIEAALRDGFTSVQGKVESGVTPFRVPDVVTTAGECRLFAPPTLFCDPACGAGTTCDASGDCVTAPSAVSVGTVTVTGLKAAVEMTASPPVFFYTNLDPLDHPGFDEGAALTLVASGEGDVEPFVLDARGIAALELAATSVALEVDEAIALQWTAPGQADVGEIHLNLNIALHGGTPGWIECTVADTGQFEIPVALTNQLLGNGFSGFPALEVTRRSADSTTIVHGCVQWVAQSTVVLDVEIAGLISCSDDDDCPDPQTCQGDLTCG